MAAIQKSKSKLVDDEESVRTMNARHKVRSELESDIEAFLSRGGAIQEIEQNVMADPPTKPATKYGGRPI